MANNGNKIRWKELIGPICFLGFAMAFGFTIVKKHQVVPIAIVSVLLGVIFYYFYGLYLNKKAAEEELAEKENEKQRVRHEIELRELELEKASADLKLQRLKEQSQAKPENGLEKYEKKLQDTLSKEQLRAQYKRQEKYQKLMSERQSHRELKDLFQKWEDDILQGRSVEDLSDAERLEWEDLLDWKTQKLSGL